MASAAPVTTTVYIQNLEERVKVEKITEVLRLIFSRYGNIVDIVAKTSLRAKGQAFVVFERPESALQAIEEVNGFEIYEKPMRLALAKSRSDAAVELHGSNEELDVHKRRRAAEKDKRLAAEAAEEQKRQAMEGTQPNAPAKAPVQPGQKPAPTGGVVPDEYLPPNKILFVRNLPEDYDTDALSKIFGRFEGFREVRLVPGRRGIAFIEYENEQGAITAKENTAGMNFGSANVIKVTYQRQ